MRFNLYSYADASSKEKLKDEDSSKMKAVVIGVKDGFCLVQSLPNDGQCSYYKLDSASVCIDIDGKTPLPGVFVFLKIDGLENLPKKEYIPDTNSAEMKDLTSVWIKQRITHYRIDKLAVAYYKQNHHFVPGTEERRIKRNKSRREPEYFGEEQMQSTVVLVVEPKTEYPNVIRVVGKPARKGFLAACDFEVQKYQYVKARVLKSAPFFTLKFMFGTLCLYKNHAKEYEYNQWEKTNKERYETYRELITQIYQKENQTTENIEKESLVLSTYKNCTAPRDGLPLLVDIKPLSSNDDHLIITQCRGVTHCSLEMARMYIRDPAYICSRVSSYETYKKAQQFKVEEKTRCCINGKNYRIELVLDKEKAKRVTNPNEDGSWKIGSELKIEHEALKRQRIGIHGVQNKRTAFIRLDSIDERKDGKVMFTFIPAPASSEIFGVLCDDAIVFKGAPPKIGPEDEDSSSDNIALGLKNFDKFFNNVKLFDRYRGIAEDKDEASKVMNLIRNMDLNSGISNITLDKSQRAALHAALTKLYFTAIEAPPGTGKTHLICALKAQCFSMYPDKRMILTATTNNAINNAVEKTVTLRPDYHIIRDISLQGELVASKLLREYTLNTRCQRPLPDDRILGQEDKLKEKLAKALFEYEAAKRSFEDKNLGSFKRLSILELIHDTNSILKRTYLKAAVPYVIASTPTILNRHGRHYSASSSISHLVVDEASQLPAYMALALYCSFPYFERITIIGDSKQLGPHCLQKKEAGLLYHMMSQSELDRVTALKTMHTCRLTFNYRCPKALNDLLLKDIYKNHLNSGLHENQRCLHLTHQLPVSKFDDKGPAYPIRFYNIGGNSEKGYNPWEVNEVINLLRDLLINAHPNHRLDRKDVVVLCFYKRQKFEIEKAILKHIPTLSEGKEEICVSTIDSYQGKDNKVVLICTTKTCENLKNIFKKMSFVADSRRCTVALSRAQEAIYIFGQWNKLLKTPFWGEYKYMINNGFKQNTTGVLKRLKKSDSNKEDKPMSNQVNNICW